MRIRDWSSDVCSSDITIAHRCRTVVAMAKLFAGARAVVVFVEALPDQIGAKPWRRFEGDRGAQRPKVAAVDAVLGHAVIIVTIAVGHRPGHPDAENVVDERHVEHRGHAAAIVVADLRSEEHTSELQSLMRISYAVFCLIKKTF